MYRSVGAAAAGCLVLGFIANALKQAYQFFQRLMATMEEVEKRSKQLEPNGGHSMRDEVSAMREQVALQLATMEAQREIIEDLQARPRLGIRLRR